MLREGTDSSTNQSPKVFSDERDRVAEESWRRGLRDRQDVQAREATADLEEHPSQ